jgi:hypothetical protein
MNIGKSIHFLRLSERLNWHKGQPLSHAEDQQGNEKIIEYQDRWTVLPSRGQFWLKGKRNPTEHNNACWPW